MHMWSQQNDLKQITEEAVNKISTYFNIEDFVGKYQQINEKPKIKKIGLLVKPMFTNEIDISDLILKISNGEQVRILYYSGESAFIQKETLFDHPIWKLTDECNFSLIVTLDKDKSLISYDTFNDYTDTAYLIINLPKEFVMQKGETITITLFPATGITRTIVGEAPLPIKSVVNLY